MALSLHGFANDYRTLKSLVAANYAEVDLEVADFKPEDMKSAEFKSLNPLGTIPALKTPHGTIAGPNVVARYVASLGPAANLLGGSFKERAEVDQWVDFIGYDLEPMRDIWIFPLYGLLQREKKAYQNAKQHVSNVMAILNEYLSSRTYLVGQRISLADIALASALFDAYMKVFDAKYRKRYVHVTRHFQTICHQPQFAQVFGDIKFADKEEMPGKQAKKQKQKGNKGQSSQPAAKPAAAKPKKKPKNPLDALPPSKMNLENTKRLFSNNTFEAALKKFYEDFDAEGFSLWISNYNYNEDNSIDFMTSNLCGGYLQRLESARKYAFGRLNISGTGPYEITGAWVTRGLELPAEIQECPDSEYHTFKKVDLGNSASKAKFEEYLGRGDVVDGKPVYERKYFK